MAVLSAYFDTQPRCNGEESPLEAGPTAAQAERERRARGSGEKPFFALVDPRFWLVESPFYLG